ncbi:hypothetical protein ACFL3E_00740 [Patescibacteria group bacterium]
MSFFTDVLVGILLNAFISAVVGISSTFLAVFLFRRWKKLNSGLKTYSVFWLLNSLVWIIAAIRYTIIAFGTPVPNLYLIDYLIQSMAFIIITLIVFYTGLRITNNKTIITIMVLASIAAGIIAIYYFIQLGGITYEELSFFSADSILNNISMIIFTSQGAIVMLLLIYDLGLKIKNWYSNKSKVALYNTLFTVSLIAYFIVGAIDHMKLFHDWTLIAFRILYCAIFLFVYIIVTLEEEVTADPYRI